MALKTSRAYVWESRGAVGNQHEGSSLKSSQVKCEGDTLTNFRACAGGAGSIETFSRDRRAGGRGERCLFCLFLFLPPIWSDTSRCHFQHSPLILLMLFTPPWHFPEDMSQLTSLQSGSCPRHTWWVASVNISTQQCVCNTLGWASKPAMSEAPPAYPSTHNGMARPHSHCTTGPHRTPSI